MGIMAVRKEILYDFKSNPLFCSSESKPPEKAIKAEGIPKEKNITNNCKSVSANANKP